MSTTNGIDIGDQVTLDPNVIVALTTGVTFKVVGLGGDDRISIAVTLPNGVSGRLDFVPASAASKHVTPVHVGDKLTDRSPEPPVGTVLIDRLDNEVIVRKRDGSWVSSDSARGYTSWPGIAALGHTYEVIAV